MQRSCPVIGHGGKMMMRYLVFLLAVSTLFLSCRKANNEAGERVEIYLLKSYKTVAAKCQVDPSSAVLQKKAIVKNEDIIQYAKDAYQFTLTDNAFQNVKTLGDVTPFAVTLGRQVVYFGFYKPATSSASCPHSITMGIDPISGNKIYLKLGYPGVAQGTTIKDERNHQQLLTALARQGKLK